MHRRVVTAAEFERARRAFADAWHDRDSRPSVPGERSAAGLRAALLSLDIVVDHVPDERDERDTRGVPPAEA